MKTAAFILAFLFVAAAPAGAQFKSQEEQGVSVSRTLVHPGAGISSFLGFLDPNSFMMHHSLSFSYATAGGTGLSLASYTNSMLYRVSDPLQVRFDLTLQGSPFGNYGAVNQGDLSRLYLSRAELNYHPWENFNVNVQYRQIPFGTLINRPYSSPLFWGDE